MSNVIAMVIAVLIRVESGGDAYAVGDDGRAIGVLQMHKCAVDEANRIEVIAARKTNRIVGEKRWTYSDRYDPAKSREMCRVTLERNWRRGVRDPVALACRWRNPNGRNIPRWHRSKIEKAMKEVAYVE